MSAPDDCPGCKNNRPADSGETQGKIRASQGENRILVTGAAGFTGKRLVAALAARGYRVRALVRRDNGDAELKAARAQIYTGDIRDPKVVDWAMDGVTGVFHLASIVQKAGIPDQEFWDTHVRATESLLEAARKYGVRKFVHCSTIGVLGHITHPPADESAPYNVEDIYQITKAEGEKKALAFFQSTGLPVTVVRPAAVYGPGDTRLLKLFKLIARGRFYIIGDGAALIHPVYVDDLVEGMVRAYESLDSAGRVYIIGGGQFLTIRQWVEIIAHEAGTTLPSLRLPYAPIRALAGICEAVCKPFGVEPPLFRRRVDFFVKNRAFSIERARRELGYEPQVGLKEGARRTLAWYRERGLLG